MQFEMECPSPTIPGYLHFGFERAHSGVRNYPGWRTAFQGVFPCPPPCPPPPTASSAASALRPDNTAHLVAVDREGCRSHPTNTHSLAGLSFVAGCDTVAVGRNVRQPRRMTVERLRFITVDRRLPERRSGTRSERYKNHPVRS